jgi:isoleucyl-tRNA synthetase
MNNILSLSNYYYYCYISHKRKRRTPTVPRMPSVPRMPEVSSDFAQIHHEVMMIMDTGENVYFRMIEKNRHNPHFKIMDGPPFVSGSLHYGHLAVSSAKSTVFIYKTMKGFNCSFKMGFDCHGLPIEILVCKEHILDTLEKIQEIGLAEFNRLCDEIIDTVSSSWTPSFKQLGRHYDPNDTYMTRDKDFMESVIWIFKELYNKGLVYKGNKVMAYSYVCRTGLSNFEANQNYKDIETKSVYVVFELDNESNDKEFFVAWTTTPWTLPMNLALCVNDNLDYVKVKLQNSDDTNTYIVGKNSIKNLFGKKQKYTILDEFKGSELVGLRYKPLFPYMDNVDTKNNQKYKVLSDNYVTEGKIGTGIVHLAPAFGEDDFRVCEKNGIVSNITVSEYCPIDPSGKYTDTIAEYKDRLVFDCEDDIRQHLKRTRNLIKIEKYGHRYPYCWRTDTPLIYRTMDSWYIKVTALKDRMIELNQSVSWYPKEIGSGRFHQWLSNLKDWAISRPRLYGTPIPLWVSEDGDIICIGSIEELAELSGITVTDLHPQYVNDIVIEKDGKTYKRIPEVFDCWFESGSAQFAQLHYPFNPESKVLEERKYLYNFICEGLDQTRGWFYTSLVLSTAILGKASFEHVMCTGFVLDKDGNKLSKKNKNYTDPMGTLQKHGADVLRVNFLKSKLMNAGDLKFNENDLGNIKKQLLPYINGLKFLIEHTTNLMTELKTTTYMIDELKSEDLTNLNLMDRWLVSLTDELVSNVVNFMDTFQLSRAVELLLEYIDNLTNWYIKFNRDRLKGSKGIEEWKTSTKVLYNVLMTYCRLWAPFTPFLSEYIYQRLRVYSDKYKDIDSVLLTDFPTVSDIKDTDSLTLMKDLQKICSMVRQVRNSSEKHSSQVVPLLELTIYHNDEKHLETLQENITIIGSDINCLSVSFESLRDNVTVAIRPKMGCIGPIFQKEAKEVVKYLTNQTPEFMMSVYEGKECFTYNGKTLTNEYYDLSMVPNHTNESKNVKSVIQGELMVSVNPTYNGEVHNIYQNRKLRSAVQMFRKGALLRPWDSITVVLDNKYSNPDIVATLSKELKNVEIMSKDNDESIPNGKSEVELEGKQCTIWKEDYTLTTFNNNELKGFLMIYY